jgi:hypothetical protein
MLYPIQVAIEQAKGLIAGTVKPSKRKRDWMSYFMEETPLRSIMFSQARKTVDKNSGGHYPSPYAIIDLLDNSRNFKVQILQLFYRFLYIACVCMCMCE